MSKFILDKEFLNEYRLFIVKRGIKESSGELGQAVHEICGLKLIKSKIETAGARS